MPAVDMDWSGVDDTKWCGVGIPDRVGQCSRVRGHIDPEHVAHWNSPGSSVHGQWFARWHDGDTVSVKAGQMKTVSAVPPAPAYQWMRIPATTAPSMKYSICLSCRAAWEDGKASTCVCKKTPATEPALAQPSRRELAAELYKRVIDWGSSFRTDRERYQQWSDLVVMLRKEKAE